MSTTKPSVSHPLSEPALARRAPAELVAHTDEPPPSIRCGAQASRPPSQAPEASPESSANPESSVQPIAGAVIPKGAKVPAGATG